MTLQLKRNSAPIRMRNYGRIVQDMIAYASALPKGQERETLEVYIAQCMRQRNLIWNRDQEAGIQRVREDLLRLSGGKLKGESAVFEQLMAQPNAQLMGKKKKK